MPSQYEIGKNLEQEMLKLDEEIRKTKGKLKQVEEEYREHVSKCAHTGKQKVHPGWLHDTYECMECGAVRMTT